MCKKYFVCVIFFLWSSAQVTAQNTVTDSLMSAVKNGQQDSAKVLALNELAGIAWKKSEYEGAFSYATQAKKLAEKGMYKKGLSKALHILGLVNMYRGNYEEAQKNNLSALALRKELGDKQGISSSYNSMGNVFQYQGNYPASLKNHLEALRIREELGDKTVISQSYNNIGNIYYSQGNLQEALRYYQLALKMKIETGNKAGMASSYNNIGLIYFEEHKYDEALKNYMASIPIEVETDDKLNLAVSYNNVARVNMIKRSYQDALENNFIALKLQEEIGEKYGMARSFAAIGAAYKELKEYTGSLSYSHKALNLAQEIEAYDFIFEASTNLSDVYATKKNFKEALVYYKLYVAARDSLINEENTKKTVRLEMNYEFEKKENAAKLDRERKEAVAQAETRKQRIILLVISGFGLLVLGFAIFAYRSFLQKKRANVEISFQKNLIEEKQKEILDSIHYAKRIQTALIPSESYIRKNLLRLIKPSASQ